MIAEEIVENAPAIVTAELVRCAGVQLAKSWRFVRIVSAVVRFVANPKTRYAAAVSTSELLRTAGHVRRHTHSALVGQLKAVVAFAFHRSVRRLMATVRTASVVTQAGVLRTLLPCRTKHVNITRTLF